MAKLSITEYDVLPDDGRGRLLPLGGEPALADQEVTFTTATQSSAFNGKTKFIRLVADAGRADCRVLFGANPTALATSQRLVADVEYWRAVVPGQKVSAYDGSS